LEAIQKHDALQSFPIIGSKQDSKVNELAGTLKTFSMHDDDDFSESQGGTMKSFQSFASNFSACTNMSFSK
jgi:ribosomal RNA-processing protein 12